MSELEAAQSEPEPVVDGDDADDGPYTQGSPVLTSDDMLRPHYVLALKPVGADADRHKDPHDTLNWLGLNTDELTSYEGFRGLGVWGGKSRRELSLSELRIVDHGPARLDIPEKHYGTQNESQPMGDRPALSLPRYGNISKTSSGGKAVPGATGKFPEPDRDDIHIADMASSNS